MPLRDTAEHRRLEDNKGEPPQWWLWGPYVSERAWGTVREDYSADGDAWRYLTHNYARYRYQYPQARFPYEELLTRNASRGLHEGEFELLDTGVFNELRYFDVQVEYAKATPDDIGIRITVTNRGPERAAQHVLPQLWYRNTWAWREPRGAAPVIFLL